jgi:hypothetical protein
MNESMNGPIGRERFLTHKQQHFTPEGLAENKLILQNKNR